MIGAGRGAMPEGDVEYVGLVAEAWDALRGDTSGWPDRHFYLDLIRERGEPVLDVGCGTGRLLLDFLAIGIEIEGVDNSREMLDWCAAKAERAGLAATLHHQSMEALDLPRRYRTVIVPSSSFQLLVDRDDAVRALQGFHRVLLPGGTLAMPFIAFRGPSDETVTSEAPLEDATTVRLTEHAVFDPSTGIESTDNLYEVLRDGVVVRAERHVRELATRAWSEDDVAAALGEAGFGEAEWYSGFSRRPHRADDEVYTVVARAT
jgi:SAM-dependent methyltransferase